jgi:tetratricopeptide (TPR) repeat protein
MIRIYFIIIAVSLSLTTKAFDAKKLILEANDNYAKSEFAVAAQKYQAVVDSGYSSADLYFNLGNAYYKSKSLKNAILNYERAKLLDPSHSEVNFNLEMAKSQTLDKIEAMPELFFITWGKWFRNIFSSFTWSVFSVLFFIVGLALFLIYLLSSHLISKKVGFWTGTVLILFAVVSITCAYQSNKLIVERNTAIVYSPSVTVKSSPSDSGNNLFVIHEGTKVTMLDQVGVWREIRIADGNRGWVKITDIKQI